MGISYWIGKELGNMAPVELAEFNDFDWETYASENRVASRVLYEDFNWAMHSPIGAARSRELIGPYFPYFNGPNPRPGTPIVFAPGTMLRPFYVDPAPASGAPVEAIAQGTGVLVPSLPVAQYTNLSVNTPIEDILSLDWERWAIENRLPPDKVRAEVSRFVEVIPAPESVREQLLTELAPGNSQTQALPPEITPIQAVGSIPGIVAPLDPGPEYVPAGVELPSGIDLGTVLQVVSIGALAFQGLRWLSSGSRR